VHESPRAFVFSIFAARQRYALEVDLFAGYREEGGLGGGDDEVEGYRLG